MNDSLRRKILPKVKVWGTLLAFLLILFVVVNLITTANRFMQTTGITPALVFRLVFDDGIPLKSTDDRTNVLLLGIGGRSHDGSDLTDTMIVLSLNNKNHSAALISIPRDIWSDTLKDKINSAYHYGEEKKKGGGMILAKAITEDVVGIPIHYAVLIDFTGFKNLIELIGGIDVNVTKAFIDTQYPIPGKEHDTCPGDPTNACVYETVHFDKGIQHMNGDRALIYVRSRHAEGEEGTDFARSKRQQEVLLAFKDKIMHPTKWLTMRRLSQLPKALDDATDSDMNIGGLATVGRQYIKINESQVKKVAFDNLLTEAPFYLYNGLYVLIPVDNWSTIQSYIAKAIQ
jgi:polyisoprenyl-teichoic acid--peptidoglycan teichoic acid transferase